MANEKLLQISERVGAMSLRERVFIFVAALVVGIALVQTLLIDTEQRRKQTAQSRLLAADATLAQIAQQRKVLAGKAGADPDQAVRQTLAAQEMRLAALNDELEARGRSLVPPERMHQVLKEVVREQGKIRLVSFKTLTPQPALLPDATVGALPGFYRHGFEMTVSGRYPELLAYLERLEALPWNLNWIEATLDAAARPELTLTLTVHTLSLEEAWLRV